MPQHPTFRSPYLTFGFNKLLLYIKLTALLLFVYIFGCDNFIGRLPTRKIVITAWKFTPRIQRHKHRKQNAYFAEIISYQDQG